MTSGRPYTCSVGSEARSGAAWDRIGCIRPLAVVCSVCPLSPTIGTAFGADSAVGERAGVRGLEREMWPPHPTLSPQSRPRRRSHRQWGEGANGRPPVGECTQRDRRHQEFSEWPDRRKLPQRAGRRQPPEAFARRQNPGADAARLAEMELPPDFQPVSFRPHVTGPAEFGLWRAWIHS